MLDSRLLDVGPSSSSSAFDSSLDSSSPSALPLLSYNYWKAHRTPLIIGLVLLVSIITAAVVISILATRTVSLPSQPTNGTAPSNNNNSTPANATMGSVIGWRQAGGNAQHSGVSNYTWPVNGASTTNFNLSLRWNLSLPYRLSYMCDGGLVSDSHGRLYFTCISGNDMRTYATYCVNGSTGAVLWTAVFSEPYYLASPYTPALSEDETLVIVRSTSLQAFSSSNGSLKWQQLFAVTGGSIRTAPLVKGDTLYINGQGGVQAYRVSTGVRLWQSATITNTGPVARSVSPVLTPSGAVILSAVQQIFNASADHSPNPRLHLLATNTRTGGRLWYWNVSLVFDQITSGAQSIAINYAMSHSVEGRELFYLSMFPFGLLVVDALDGSVVSWGQHSATLQNVNVSPVLWPASAPNNPYGESAILNFVQTGTCYWTAGTKIPCKYQLAASSLTGEPLSPPLPPPSLFNNSFACPSSYSVGSWSAALPASQPIMTANGLLLAVLAASASRCFIALDPSTGHVVDLWNASNTVLQYMYAGWALLQNDGQVAFAPPDDVTVFSASKPDK